MQSTIHIPSPLRRFTGGNARIEAIGNDVQTVLDDLFSNYPEIHRHLIDEKGGVRNFVNIYIGSENIRDKEGFETSLDAGSEIRIIPSIAGGSDPTLSPKEFRRYSRHYTLPEVGIEGQKKLKAAKALIIGLGGLGSPVSLYLSAAGVGTIGMVDYDVVDETNLQRQIIYGVEHVGQSKLKVARERLFSLNPHLNYILHEEPLSSQNALDIIKNYDVVIDGTDNFPTRYLVNDACVLLGKPNVYGSIFRFDGQASVFNYEDGPCYRCLYPEPPPPGLVPSCAEGGVLGVLPGIIGSIQANEAMKIIMGIGETLKNRFVLFDALTMSFNELKIRCDENCVVCGDNPTVTELIDYTEFCGIPSQDELAESNDITVSELKNRLDSKDPVDILDVREEFELQIAHIPGAIHIPMNEVPKRLEELSKENELVVMCRTGVRSSDIRDFLKNNDFKNVRNLTGGIRAWSEEIDPSVPVY